MAMVFSSPKQDMVDINKKFMTANSLLLNIIITCKYNLLVSKYTIEFTKLRAICMMYIMYTEA